MRRASCIFVSYSVLQERITLKLLISRYFVVFALIQKFTKFIIIALLKFLGQSRYSRKNWVVLTQFQKLGQSNPILRGIRRD